MWSLGKSEHSEMLYWNTIRGYSNVVCFSLRALIKAISWMKSHCSLNISLNKSNVWRLLKQQKCDLKHHEDKGGVLRWTFSKISVCSSFNLSAVEETILVLFMIFFPIGSFTAKLLALTGKGWYPREKKTQGDLFYPHSVKILLWWCSNLELSFILTLRSMRRLKIIYLLNIYLKGKYLSFVTPLNVRFTLKYFSEFLLLILK